jgi:hypothetical protein
MTSSLTELTAMPKQARVPITKEAEKRYRLDISARVSKRGKRA